MQKNLYHPLYFSETERDLAVYTNISRTLSKDNIIPFMKVECIQKWFTAQELDFNPLALLKHYAMYHVSYVIHLISEQKIVQ